MDTVISLTEDEWNEKGIMLFGENRLTWRFKCPICHYVAQSTEWIVLGAPNGAIGFSCVGRWMDRPVKTIFNRDVKGKGPCNYAGGGLFCFNPVHVTRDSDGKVHEMFEFEESFDDSRTNQATN